jgi:hypothetical protein
MADQNKVYAFKVKEVYPKQAATEAERQRNRNAEQTPKTQSEPSIWASLVRYEIRGMTTTRGHVCNFLIDKDLAGFRVDASM